MEGTSLMETKKVWAPRRQCTAKSKQSGERCRRAPIPGGTVCVIHGGGTPTTREAAQRRLLAAADAAAAVLVRVMGDSKATPRDAIAAAQAVLDRAGLARAQSLSIDDARTRRADLERLSDADLERLAAIARAAEAESEFVQ